MLQIPQDLDPRLWRVLGGIFISFLGVGLTLPFLLVYLSEVRGFSVFVASLVIAWMSLVAIAVTPLAGRVTDRRGPCFVLTIALACAGLGAISLAFASTLAGALLATGLNAAGWTTAAAAEFTLLSRLAKEDTAKEDTAKEWVYGGQYLVGSAGIGIGAMISGLYVSTEHVSTFQTIYLVDGVTYLLYAIVIATMSSAGTFADDNEGSQRFREALTDPRFRKFLGICVVFFICTAGQIESGFPAYATQVAEASPRTIGLAFVANTALIVAGQLLLIPTLVGRGRTKLLGLCGLVWAVSWVVVGLAGIFPGTVVAVGLLIGGLMIFSFGEIMAAPVAPALVNDMAPDRLRGSFNAAYGLAFSLGSLVGPIITAVTIGAGFPVAWVAIVSVGCLTAGIMMFRLGRQFTDVEQGLADPTP